MTDYRAQTYAQLLQEILRIRRKFATAYQELLDMKEEVEKRANLQEDFEKVQKDEVKRKNRKYMKKTPAIPEKPSGTGTAGAGDKE